LNIVAAVCRLADPAVEEHRLAKCMLLVQTLSSIPVTTHCVTFLNLIIEITER